MAEPITVVGNTVTPTTGGILVETVTPQPTQEAKFTQADLDRIITERLGRVESKYADYADLKKKVEDADTASKSESEKLLERATKAETRAKEIEKASKLATARLSAATLAGELEFDPKRLDKVLRLIEITEDSTAESLKVALEALKKELPELLTKKGAPNTGAANPDKTNGNGSTETDAQRRQRLYGFDQTGR